MNDETRRTWRLLLRVNAMAVLPIALILTAVSDVFAWSTFRRHLLVVLVMTNVNFMTIRLLKRHVWRRERKDGSRAHSIEGVVILSASVAVSTSLAGLALELVAPGALRISLPMAVLIGAVLTMLFGFGIITHEDSRELNQETAEKLAETRERERAISKACQEAQLTALQALIKPHFLFNSLNAIATLIQEDAEKAEEITLKLARLLRNVLDIQNQPVVSLSHELAILRCYLEIEEVRRSDRLSYEIDVPSSMHDMSVPPMLFQPLVENAIKHGISQRLVPGRVTVRGRAINGQGHFEVIDNGPGCSSKQGTGSGLRLVRGQLENIYGSDCELSLRRDEAGGRTIVSLRIPMTYEGPAETAEEPS